MPAGGTAVIAGVAAILFGCSASAAQAAAVQRYNGVLRGGVVATGNTLGLSKALNVNQPGTLGSIGTFIAAGTTAADGSYPAGTTSDWTADASDAVLTLPAGSEVVRAELIWGGSYQYVEDVSAFLDTNISLGSGGDSTSVAPDAATKTTTAGTASSGFAVRYYTRSADVTSFVAAHGSATYRVGGVPATQADSINQLNAAGWTLAVVYRQASEPDRAVSLTVGGDFVDESAISDVTITGFCTPDSGSVSARILASALEGDADSTGDQLEAGPTTSSLTLLSGSNNSANNFFGSQINHPDGTLDTSGTFGSANHNAAAATNVSGGRQSWDVTGVTPPVGVLGNHQTSFVVRAQTTGDNYLPTMIATQVGVNAARLSATAALGDDSLTVGEATTLTVSLDNTGGPVAAKGVSLKVPLPAGVGLASFTIDNAPGDAHGGTVAAADLTTGVDVGDIAAGATKVVRIGLTADAAGTYPLSPSWTHSSLQCAGATPTAGSGSAPAATLTVSAPASTTPTDGTTTTGGTTTTTGGTTPTTGGTTPTETGGTQPTLALDRASFGSFLPRGPLRADRKGRVTFVLGSPVAVATKAALVLAAGRRTRRPATFGRGSVTLPAKATRRLRIQLSKSARKLLRRHKRMVVRVTATVTADGVHALTLRRTLTILRSR